MRRQSLTMSMEEWRALLVSSFRRNYREDMPQIFLQALIAYGEMCDVDAHYGHSIPILQSSATGKSRLVAEGHNQDSADHSSCALGAWHKYRLPQFEPSRGWLASTR
ncbi:uncharacterized protein EI90DRAFT_3057671 [Cantharellus anzutake]|uniref:uncharacterized protein n=1 Tax=Cantharellus anzutake TaxID=1750568 RepID=UPI0019068580|nr:uncharacterized protein EI90DRAFT_3057671 [Cantharellus anzutake]KAF8331361.1 hypothetical protein EI90DRAFT_3057671 [Cantharellus anzutake]